MIFPDRFASYFKEEAVIGLDIGEAYITAASISNGRMVDRIAWVKNESSGRVKEVISSLKKLWKKERLAVFTVVSSFHSQSLTLKHFSYKNLSDEELKSALQLEAEHTFQKPGRELYLDWYLYPQGAGSNDVKEGILAVANKKEVNKYLYTLRAAGLYPVVLDVCPMALANAFLEFGPQLSGRAVCIVNLDTASAEIAIISEGLRIYPRNLYLKSASLKEKTDYLIEGIRDMLKYYQFKLRQSPVEKLVFTGKPAFDEEFQIEIKNMLREFPIEFWNPLQGMTLKKGLSAGEIGEHGPLFASSLGLALRGR